MWTQAFGGQKTALDLLELELPADVSKTDVGARTKLRSSASAVSTFNHRVTSSTPNR